jgi:large subunit ribosomal protein L23
MNKERLLNALLVPHLSEKAMQLAEKSNTYVFRVRSEATKPLIKAAIEKLFNVNVIGVRVVNTFPKAKLFKGLSGRRKSFKKAYITLSSGQTIDLSGVAS